MMTLILVVSALLIAFIGLLRYDIHKHKHSNPTSQTPPGGASAQPAEAEEQRSENKT